MAVSQKVEKNHWQVFKTNQTNSYFWVFPASPGVKTNLQLKFCGITL